MGAILPDRNLNILIRMPNWLGDCIMALPALHHLGEALPAANIYLAGRAPFRELFLAQRGVAGFVEAPGSGFANLVGGLTATKSAVTQGGVPGPIDVGILFTNSLSTAAWMWRTGAAIRIGYNLDCRRVFLSHPVPCGGVEKAWHFIRYYIWLAKFAESTVSESKDVSRRETRPLGEYFLPELSVGEKGRAQAASLLAGSGFSGRYAVIAPASAYGEVKDWPAAHYRRLVEDLNRRLSLPVVITGGAGQQGVCEAIASGQDAAINLAGKTDLDAFAGLLAGAALFVGGDSGGAHVAAALGVPTLVIFGITNPSRTRPSGKKVREIGRGEDHDVKLSTLEAREAAKSALSAIQPETVLETAIELMAK